MRVLLAAVLACLLRGSAAQSSFSPKAAVDAVTTDWTSNEFATVPELGRSLPLDGSWSVQRVNPATTAIAQCKDAPVCFRVLYRIKDSALLCSFIVAPGALPDSSPLILDLNDEAAAYMVKQKVKTGNYKLNLTGYGTLEYPPIAKAAHLEGEVTVLFQVNRDGTVVNVGTPAGSQMLSRSAVSFVQSWRCKPVLLNGRAIAVRGQFTVNYLAGGAHLSDMPISCPPGMTCPGQQSPTPNPGPH